MKYNSFKLIDIVSYKKSKGFLSGNYKTLFEWAWIEFEDLSQYSFWDNIKSIDWLTSAKRDDIYIKKYQEEKEFPLLFLFDISSSMYFALEDKSKLDTAIELFKIISLSGLKTNSPIWVSFFQNDEVVNLEPKRWKINILRTFKLLSQISKHYSAWNNSFANIVNYLFKSKIRNNIIFIFTDKTNIEIDNKIKALAIQNDLVCINISDVFENNLSENWLMNLWNSLLSRVINFSNNSKKELYIKERQSDLDEAKKSLIAIWWDFIAVDNKTDLFKTLYNFFVLRKKLN